MDKDQMDKEQKPPIEQLGFEDPPPLREKKPTHTPEVPFMRPVVQPLPTSLVEPSSYAAMLNGPGVNQLALVNAKTRSHSVNLITGEALITKGDLKVFIDQYNELTGALRVSTQKLLDICTLKLTAQNNYRNASPLKPVVSFSLDEYMSLCGIPPTKASKDKARRRVKEDLEALYNISLEWSERRGPQTRDYVKMRVLSGHGIKNSHIIVEFSAPLATYLNNAYVMQYPKSLLRIDERNPAAFYIGRKLLQHHSIDNNQRIGTAHLIGVSTLLACCEEIIPSYAQVMAGDRHVSQKIIAPFENALDSLANEGIIRWEYCNRKYEPLTPEQLKSIEYDTFISLFVRFEPLGAPERRDG